MSGTIVYVGCAAGRAITVYSLDADSGALQAEQPYRTAGEVQWLASGPDGLTYTALRTDPPTVETLRTGSEPGQPAPVGTGPLAASMAYLSVDATGKHLLGASYTDDIVTVSGIAGTVADGSVSDRQSPGAHAHCVLASPDNRFVYATSLGDDRVAWWAFDDDAGTLGSGSTVECAPGSGPRHLRFSSSGDYLYLLHEMSGAVTVYERNRQTGALTDIQTIATVPEAMRLVPGRVRDGSGPEPEPNAIWCAELRLTADDRFLYTTERTSSTVSWFAVDPATGLLAYAGTLETERQPRGMNIDPSSGYLLICGEASNQVTVYRIDPGNGTPVELGSYPCADGPRAIEFAVLP